MGMCIFYNYEVVQYTCDLSHVNLTCDISHVEVTCEILHVKPRGFRLTCGFESHVKHMEIFFEG